MTDEQQALFRVVFRFVVSISITLLILHYWKFDKTAVISENGPLTPVWLLLNGML